MVVQGELFDRVVFTGNARQLAECFPGVDELRPFLPRISALRSHGTTSVLCRIDPNDYSWIYMPSPAHRPTASSARGIFPGTIIMETLPPPPLSFPSK